MKGMVKIEVAKYWTTFDEHTCACEGNTCQFLVNNHCFFDTDEPLKKDTFGFFIPCNECPLEK